MKKIGVTILFITILALFVLYGKRNVGSADSYNKPPKSNQSNVEKPSIKPPDRRAEAKDRNSILLLVNKERGLPEDWKPGDLVKVNVLFKGRSDAAYLRKEAADSLDKLFKAASTDKITLCGVSGFRSYELQRTVFSKYVSSMGEKEARRISAYPGQSEHQTGLAMDISCASMGYGLGESFGTTTEGKWLAEHAAEYGFIIRYPKNREAATGYAYEPWHIRYVGKEAAEEITEKNIILEEYLGQ